jgi:nucleoside-diphosphate-sugar epimerase
VKRAFVTGASGFLGVNLVKHLLADGWSVIALHRPSSDITYLRRFPAERVIGDITDPESLARAIPNGIDAIFHTAGNVSFDQAGDAAQNHDNIDGTRNMIEAAIARRVGRFVYTSTGATFGLHDGVTIDETTPSNADQVPINYFRTKTLAEQVVVGVHDRLDAVILNPANVVGPYDLAIWGPFLRAIKKGEIKTVGSGGGSFCQVDEVAKAHIAAFERGQRGHKYLLAGAAAPFVEVGRICAELTGGIAPGAALTRDANTTPEMFSLMSKTQLINCDKAVRALGFRPIALTTMFGDLYRWMVAEGLI